jgi:hypothetical protein
LDATSRIDRRALQKTIVLSEVPEVVNLQPPANLEPVNLEAQPISFESDPAFLEASLTLLEVQPTSTAPKSRIAPFTFRRANLVKA